MPKEPSSDLATALKGRNLSVTGSTAFSNRESARTWKAAASELEAVRRAEINPRTLRQQFLLWATLSVR